MILINILATEKKTLDSPTYLFRFIKDIQKTEVAFIAQDISIYTYRYNEFIITETSGTNDLLTGIITLSPTGFWHYEIYEQESTSNLDYLLSLNCVEIGKVKVIGTAPTIIRNDFKETFIANNPNE